MSHPNFMPIDYVPAKRRIPLGPSDGKGAAYSHPSKRYKGETYQSEYSEIHSAEAHESKHRPTQLITIPTRGEIFEAMKKEQYVQHMLAALKREKTNYIAQLKGYNMPYCGVLRGEFECEDDPKLTSKKK